MFCLRKWLKLRARKNKFFISFIILYLLPGCTVADKKVIYEKYLNTLTRIKYHAKRNYYENPIKSNNRNPSQIWSVIKEIIDCKKSSQKSILPSALLIENQMIDTDSHMFLDKLCEYFANIGINLASNIPQTNNNSFKIFASSYVQSFALQEIHEEDVVSCNWRC